MIRFSAIVTALAATAGLALLPLAASAQTHDHAQMQGHQMESSRDSAALSSGEVMKVDKQTGKLTIQHGPLDNLNMPGMTMVFKAADPAMLDKVKAGDQIRFRAEQLNGVFTVSKLELAR